MCASRKQSLTGFAVSGAVLLTLLGVAAAETAGGVALGDSQDGVTDRAYVLAPPNYRYIVEKEPGSFLDCGEGTDVRRTDDAGRDLAGLTCGVTLTETVIIPAAAKSARIVIHY